MERWGERWDKARIFKVVVKLSWLLEEITQVNNSCKIDYFFPFDRTLKVS